MLSGMVYRIMRSYQISRILICFVLCLGLVFGSALPSFAATSVDQETLYPILRNSNYTGYAYYYDSGSITLARGSGIGDNFANFVTVSTQSLKQIYSQLVAVNTKLSNISGYVDGLEGYVDGLEGLLGTNNTTLSSILSAIQNHTSYNYTSVLNTISNNVSSIESNSDDIVNINSSINVIKSVLGSDGNTGISGFSASSAVATQGIRSDFSSFVSSLAYHAQPLSVPYRNYTYQTSAGSRPAILSESAFGRIYWEWASSGDDMRIRPSIDRSISPSNVIDAVTLLNNNVLTGVFSALYTMNSQYPVMRYDSSSNTLINYRDPNNGSKIHNYSLMDSLYSVSWSLESYLGRLQYFLADDDSIQRKVDNAAVTNAALDDFTSGGDASASVSDFAGIASGLGDLKDSVSGGASASSAFAVLNGGSNAWDWFSEDTQYDLDSTSGSSSSGSRGLKSVSSVSSSSTPLLDQYYSSLLSFLGGDSDD